MEALNNGCLVRLKKSNKKGGRNKIHCEDPLKDCFSPTFYYAQQENSILRKEAHFHFIVPLSVCLEQRSCCRAPQTLVLRMACPLYMSGTFYADLYLIIKTWNLMKMKMKFCLFWKKNDSFLLNSKSFWIYQWLSQYSRYLTTN